MMNIEFSTIETLPLANKFEEVNLTNFRNWENRNTNTMIFVLDKKIQIFSLMGQNVYELKYIKYDCSILISKNYPKNLPLYSDCTEFPSSNKMERTTSKKVYIRTFVWSYTKTA